MHQKENAHPHKAEMSAHKSSANATTAITLTHGVLPRVDSRLLAQHMGVKHKNSMELLVQHKADFLELGVVPFQTEKPSGPNGGRPERFALLNEDQAYLLLTYSRNTATVRALKVKLVKAFSEARKAAQQRQTEYLPSYRLAHDALKGLAPDEKRQQHLHMNVNKLLNKVAGIEAGQRGTAKAGSLSLLTAGQIVAAHAATGATDHKAAYARVKTAMQSLHTLLLASGGGACC